MWKIFYSILSLVLFCAAQAEAHFGMVIPSAATITEKKDANLKIDLAFAHPMEMKGMDMAAPKAFTVTVDGRTEDVRYLLKPSVILGHKAWQAAYAVKKPGVYQFAVAQAPYFEPAEDTYIVHYTKTVTAAFGGEDGWNEPLGLKTEIVPLTRPFGNYAGNIFRGQVLLNGKPAPNTDVEVEFWNTDGRRTAPNEYFLTQIVRTDQNGVFAFGVPWAGWWGFAALSTADEKLDYKGEQKPIELGAVLWTEFVAPRTK
ncbi:DUF4198 domain-containing protein [Candidatus Desulfovibrio trichonymphae]|uniref:Ni2+ ABC transporter Ni2+-binding protein NikK n=1 Tax=Candidatus Desulfovibrio trichonymphae TaxID=1725232 RepID=A0A1J1DQ61_9BACT|nr:DUF4198 domain-containing protein [Candidatus Desulfovibrio trichonymphae]BAV91975.1 Ni2+ ABC transporter Ni2+-binding protein NikK [Candidatus Desulfovibrio trichonymphae]GHU96142.1 ATP-dependent DNA ligase [Deltaproteobacteria bacterium]GHU99443.1 ATP-dependent DNA ligase [Deltaproteobacteria bacterium]